MTPEVIYASPLQRARLTAQAIEDITHKHPEENIVIVAHGVAIGIALSHLLVEV